MVKRLGAPPIGVPEPPMLVPQATAMSRAEPKGLLLMSSIPMKRSIASTMGIIAAATTALGSAALKTAETVNQARI